MSYLPLGRRSAHYSVVYHATKTHERTVELGAKLELIERTVGCDGNLLGAVNQTWILGITMAAVYGVCYTDD